MFDFREHVFRTVRTYTFLTGAKKVYFEDLNEDMFLEVQNETCS